MANTTYYGVAVGNVTINQVPGVRAWLGEIQSEFNVTVKVTDDGRVTVNGNNKKTCDEAMAALKSRVREEDFQNALDIADLLDKHADSEQFSIDAEKEKLLAEQKNNLMLTSQLDVSGCVAKIDNRRQVTIFGEKFMCQSIRRFIEGLKEEHPTTESSDQQNPPATALTAEVAGAIDDVMAGRGLVDTIENELSDTNVTPVCKIRLKEPKEERVFGCGSVADSSGKDTTTMTKRQQPDNVDAGVNQFRLKESKSEDRTFGGGAPTRNQQQLLQSQSDANRSRFGVAYPFKEKLTIPNAFSGRVLGRQHRHREYIEKRFSCYLQVKHASKEFELSDVLIEGTNRENVKAAKEYVEEFLKKDFTEWRNSGGSNSSNKGDPGFYDSKAAGDCIISENKEG